MSRLVAKRPLLLLLLLNGTLAQVVAPAAEASKLSQSKVQQTAAAAEPATADRAHVLELFASNDEGALQSAVRVFEALGADAETAAGILGKVQTDGAAVIMEGQQTALEQVAAAFEELGLKSTVRPKAEGGAEAVGAAPAAAATAAAASPQAASRPAATPSASAGGSKAAGTVYSKEYAGTGVDVLDAAGFASQLGQPDSAAALVVFFAPWCGHCVKMVPEVAKAAARLGAAGVRVVAVDCDRAPEVARSLGVKGYPTVKCASQQALMI